MNAERAGRRAGHNLKLKAAAMPPESSRKLQASSATKRPQLKNIIKMKGINNEKEYKEHS